MHHGRSPRIGNVARVALTALGIVAIVGCAGRSASSDLRRNLQWVQRIEFVGNEAFSDRVLKSVMSVKQPGITHPFRRSYYFRDLLLKDLAAVRDHYRDHGYLDFTVTSYEETFSDDQRAVSLTITVDEGPVTRTGTLSFEGATVFDERELRDVVNLERGKPYSPFVSQGDVTRLRRAYADRGYLFVHVSKLERLVDGTIDVTFSIEEGRPARLRYLNAIGNDQTKRHYITREVDVSRGEVLTGRDVRRTQRRLSEMGLFSMVRPKTLVVDSTESIVDLEIHVRERKHGWYGFGFGFTSDERVRTSAEWGHRNVWGTARRVQASGAIGWDVDSLVTEGADRSSTERLLQATWVEPWVLGTPVEASFSVFHELDQKPQSFRYRTNGARATFSRDVSEFVSLFFTLQNDWVESTDTTLTSLDFTRQSVRIEGERDTRDNILDPRRGSVQRGTVQYSRLEGDYAYLKTLASTSNAVPQNPERSRLFAFRVQGGYIASFRDPGDEDPLNAVPYQDRFFIGGATSLRGYRREDVGPLGDDGLTRGGTVLFLANAELRFPLIWRLAGGMFLDAGNVWASPSDLKLSHVFGELTGRFSRLDLRYAAGVGVRLQTPVGPFRVDYARKLARDADTAFGRSTELHFSLGHAF